MKNRILKATAAFFAVSFMMSISANGSQLNSKGKPNSEKTALMKRIDFGNSYIMGQSIKSGAVYLLQRKKSEISSMLKYRSDYRAEILEDFQVKELENDQKVEAQKP